MGVAGKSEKRRAQQLWDRSEEMFAAGDYRGARAAAAEVAALVPDHELGRRGVLRVKLLTTVDSAGLLALGVSVLIYGVAWIYALA